MKITVNQLRKIIREEKQKLQEDAGMSPGEYARGQINEKLASAAKAALKAVYMDAVEYFQSEVDPGEAEDMAAAAMQEVYNEFMDEVGMRGKFGAKY